MFPFTLAGPQFLLFYVAFALVLIVAFRIYASGGDTAGKARFSQLTDDPYQIAYLRGGPDEALRIAVVNLIDRGLLENEGTGVKAVREAGGDFVRRKLDRAILAYCASTLRPVGALKVDAGIRAALDEYDAQLQAKGLMLTPGERNTRSSVRGAVLLALAAVAVARLLQAFVRGQGNVIFLIVLAVAALFITWRIGVSFATGAGRAALSSLQVLMRRVQRQATRLRAGGTTNEALMLAAVMGLYALPADAFPFVQQVYPKTGTGSSSGSDGSWGSSCGSTSSASCGGGGSGGGGGGCGGCGGGGD